MTKVWCVKNILADCDKADFHLVQLNERAEFWDCFLLKCLQSAINCQPYLIKFVLHDNTHFKRKRSQNSARSPIYTERKSAYRNMYLPILHLLRVELRCKLQEKLHCVTAFSFCWLKTKHFKFQCCNFHIQYCVLLHQYCTKCAILHAKIGPICLSCQWGPNFKMYDVSSSKARSECSHKNECFLTIVLTESSGTITSPGLKTP